MMAGIVELAVVETLSAERPADENKRGSCQAQWFGLSADIAERAAQQNLIWPAHPVGDTGGAVGTVMRSYLAHHLGQIIDRQVYRQRGARRGQLSQFLTGRHRRSTDGRARQDNALDNARQRQLAAQRGRSGGSDSRQWQYSEQQQERE